MEQPPTLVQYIKNKNKIDKARVTKEVLTTIPYKFVCHIMIFIILIIIINNINIINNIIYIINTLFFFLLP